MTSDEGGGSIFTSDLHRLLEKNSRTIYDSDRVSVDEFGDLGEYDPSQPLAGMSSARHFPSGLTPIEQKLLSVIHFSHGVVFDMMMYQPRSIVEVGFKSTYKKQPSDIALDNALRCHLAKLCTLLRDTHNWILYAYCYNRLVHCNFLPIFNNAIAIIITNVLIHATRGEIISHPEAYLQFKKGSLPTSLYFEYAECQFKRNEMIMVPYFPRVVKLYRDMVHSLSTNTYIIKLAGEERRRTMLHYCYKQMDAIEHFMIRVFGNKGDWVDDFITRSRKCKAKSWWGRLERVYTRVVALVKLPDFDRDEDYAIVPDYNVNGPTGRSLVSIREDIMSAYKSLRVWEDFINQCHQNVLRGVVDTVSPSTSSRLPDDSTVPSMVPSSVVPSAVPSAVPTTVPTMKTTAPCTTESSVGVTTGSATPSLSTIPTPSLSTIPSSSVDRPSIELMPQTISSENATVANSMIPVGVSPLIVTAVSPNDVQNVSSSGWGRGGNMNADDFNGTSFTLDILSQLSATARTLLASASTLSAPNSSIGESGIIASIENLSCSRPTPHKYQGANTPTIPINGADSDAPGDSLIGDMKSGLLPVSNLLTSRQPSDKVVNVHGTMVERVNTESKENIRRRSTSPPKKTGEYTHATHATHAVAVKRSDDDNSIGGKPYKSGPVSDGRHQKEYKREDRRSDDRRSDDRRSDDRRPRGDGRKTSEEHRRLIDEGEKRSHRESYREEDSKTDRKKDEDYTRQSTSNDSKYRDGARKSSDIDNVSSKRQERDSDDNIHTKDSGKYGDSHKKAYHDKPHNPRKEDYRDDHGKEDYRDKRDDYRDKRDDHSKDSGDRWNEKHTSYYSKRRFDETHNGEDDKLAPRSKKSRREDTQSTDSMIKPSGETKRVESQDKDDNRVRSGPSEESRPTRATDMLFLSIKRWITKLYALREWDMVRSIDIKVDIRKMQARLVKTRKYWLTKPHAGAKSHINATTDNFGRLSPGLKTLNTIIYAVFNNAVEIAGDSPSSTEESTTKEVSNALYQTKCLVKESAKSMLVMKYLVDDSRNKIRDDNVHDNDVEYLFIDDTRIACALICSSHSLQYLIQFIREYIRIEDAPSTPSMDRLVARNMTLHLFRFISENYHSESVEESLKTHEWVSVVDWAECQNCHKPTTMGSKTSDSKSSELKSQSTLLVAEKKNNTSDSIVGDADFEFEGADEATIESILGHT